MMTLLTTPAYPRPVTGPGAQAGPRVARRCRTGDAAQTAPGAAGPTRALPGDARRYRSTGTRCLQLVEHAVGAGYVAHRAGRRADVLGARPDQPASALLLQDVRGPPGGA